MEMDFSYDGGAEPIQNWLALLSLIEQSVHALEEHRIVTVETYGNNVKHSTVIAWDERELIFRIKGDFAANGINCDMVHSRTVKAIMTNFAANHLRLILMPNGRNSAVPILISKNEPPPRDALL